MKYCTKCGTPSEYDSQQTCPSCGNPFEVKTMKWYNFLIYFGLWAGALRNISNGLGMITGYIYFNIYISQGVTPEIIYEFYGDFLKISDTFFGVLILLCAVLGVVTAVKLIKFKASAPSMLCGLYIYNGIVSFLYNFVSFWVISQKADTPLPGNSMVNIFIPLIICGFLVWANNKYFKNRDYLFVN